MRTRNALIVAILASALFSLIYFPLQSTKSKLEQVNIARVIDGDTVELSDGRHIRLLNINTPEKGEFASEFAKNFLQEFGNKTLELDNAGTEKYGRTLGRLYYEDSYVNLEIVELGYASIFLVDSGEINKFKEAQKEAYEEGLGMWKHSKYFGCISGKIDKEKEFAIIDKSCNVSVVGWSVKDETTHKFVFKQNFNQRFILYSGDGISKANEGYWARGNVWNNDRDSMFVRDSKGLLVYYDSYGY